MISLKGVSAGYNNVEIIKDINIDFKKNTITSIIGKNGCGKTTLLKTCSDLVKPYSGKILLNNEVISDMTRNSIAKKMCFLPQVRPIPNITAYNLVMHGRFPYLGFSRIPKKEDISIVDNAIDVLGISGLKDKNLYELSGGERQKVYIAMALAQDTDIYFLDEPITYLDINHQLEILEIIKGLKELGKTIVMVLHDINYSLIFSDMVCLMDKGKVAIYDKPETVVYSGKIDSIFNVSCQEVYVKNKSMNDKQYIFKLM